MNMLNPILLKMAAGGGGIFMPLYWLFGKCMHFLLDLLSNEYFLAIVIFTVLTRVVLLPINIHQQKTTSKSARIQPKIQKIQKKCFTIIDRVTVLLWGFKICRRERNTAGKYV